MALWLEHMGAIVQGYALPPETDRSLFRDAGLDESLMHIDADIRDLPRLRLAIANFSPNIVIHMAAQPLVRESYSLPVETFATNIMGTVNLLASLEPSNALEAVVVVTSDKCYRNQELQQGYQEHHPMGGHDPYSSSKACAELVADSWYKSFVEGRGIDGRPKFGLATVRAGNVIGGGDWAKDRLIPDILRSIENGKPVDIRHPHAMRPWQYVLEPLAGYLRLAQLMVEDGDAFSGPWNFGPAREGIKPVGWLVEQLLDGLGEKTSWNYVKDSSLHETDRLMLDCSKAREKLDWTPVYNLEATIARIVCWYKSWVAGDDMRQFMIGEIDTYMEIQK